MIKFTFLGTGTSQGVPVIGCRCEVCTSTDPHDKRLRCSLLIESDVAVVIDAGPDFRQQLLREGVRRLDAIVFTHEHMDHLAGLDEVRTFNFLQNKAMPVYATKQVQERIREQYSYIFKNHDYPGVPSIEFHTIDKEPFRIGNFEFVPVQLMHGSLPVLGFRIGEFTYITDANFISEEEKEKVRNCKHLCVNALRKERHHSHFNLSEAISLAQELNAGQAYLTHISHKMGKHADVNIELPQNVEFAYDGLAVSVSG